jgi:hypothetical protein
MYSCFIGKIPQICCPHETHLKKWIENLKIKIEKKSLLGNKECKESEWHSVSGDW